MSTGELRNGLEDEVRKEVAKFVNMTNRCTAAGHESDCRKLTGEVMDKGGAEEVEKEEGGVGGGE